MTGKKNLGKVVGQVAGLRVRQLDKQSTVKGKLVTTGTQIGIFKGKVMVESGFKNVDLAISRASQLVSGKVTI